MLSDFRGNYPALPGDIAALERCCSELTQRTQELVDRQTEMRSAAGSMPGWSGKSRDAFDRSIDQQIAELMTWEAGVDDARKAVENYKKVFEAEQAAVADVQARAEEIWAEYCAFPDEEKDDGLDWLFGQRIAFLTYDYDKAADAIHDQGLITAAELRAALYFTPEDVKKTGQNGEKVDYGDTQPLAASDIETIREALKHRPDSLIDLKQGKIGDCHLLASLEAYDRTPEGRKYLASLVTEHVNADGVVDGFLVRFPGLNDGKPVLVTEVLRHGDQTSSDSRDLGAIFEMAYVKSNPGGTRSTFFEGGSTASFAMRTMRQISGEPSTFKADFGPWKKDAQQAAIDAVRDGKPVVAETMPDETTPSNDISVTVDDGEQHTIRLLGGHVYTVVGADENGVTLANPWGKNNKPGGGKIGAEFTMSWEDFHAQFGDVTVGATPWKK